MPNMRVRNDEYVSEIYPYRFPAGSVVPVDEMTAERWERHGIASTAAKGDLTFKEERRAALQAELDALNAGGLPVRNYDDVITRDQPVAAPLGRAADASAAVASGHAAGRVETGPPLRGDGPRADDRKK